MNIDQQTVAEFVKLGGQYFLPIAALLRALYSGIRGKFPEGVTQIMVASFFAGLTAIVGNEQLDLRRVILEILGNTIFMAGLLSFIMAYLLRQPNRGFVFDGVVGGIIGLIAFAAWTLILGNEWPWWTFPLAIAAGAGGFIMLRIALRQIMRMVRVATTLIVIGAFLVVGAGGIMLVQTILTSVQMLPPGITPTP
jgi:hypothetical protein